MQALIPIDDVLRMQVIKDGDDLRGIELGLRDGERVDGPEVSEQFAAADELQYHVQVPVVLCRTVQVHLNKSLKAIRYDERVTDRSQYATF